LGFNAENSASLIKYSEKQYIDETERAEIEALKVEYLNGTIPTEAGLRVKLAEIPLLQKDVIKQIAAMNRAKEAEAKRFSRSELDKLYKAGLITLERFTLVLTQLGYTKEDIALLLNLYNEEKTEATKLPAKDDIVGWFAESLISVERFIEYMRRAGYEDTFINYYILAAKPEISSKDLEDLLKIKEDEYETI